MSKQANKQEIMDLLDQVDRERIDVVKGFLEESDFFTAPASTKHHLACEGGLAEHSLNVYKEFKHLVDHLGVDISEESVIIVSLFHDICKTNTYVPNYFRQGQLDKYKPFKYRNDFPMGHGEKSVILLQELAFNLTHEEMIIIRWHMGKYDDGFSDFTERALEYNCPAAFLFHYADMIATKFVENDKHRGK